MLNKIILTLSLLLIFVVSSCTLNTTNYSPREYVQWINDPDNGMISEFKSENYTYSLQYRPVPFLVLLEANSPELSFKMFDSISDEISGFQQFMLHVSSNDNTQNWQEKSLRNFEGPDQQIRYFSFSMQNDFKLIQGVDTINCSMFHFERDYGIRPYGTFLIGFECEVANKSVSNTSLNGASLKIIYKDSSFDNEEIEFNFSSNNINKIPTLKL